MTDQNEGAEDPYALARWVVARGRNRTSTPSPPPPPMAEAAAHPPDPEPRARPARKLFGESAKVALAPAWTNGGRVFACHGRTAPMAALALKNAVLNLCTLLLWRFWGKARVRRHLWGQSTAWGDPVEYTGTGMELFVGFVLAVVVVFLPLAGLGIAGKLWDIGILTAIPQFAFAILIPAASWRARRYMLSRTRWRGIAFGLSGSEWVYARKALWSYAVNGLTLGWAYPWADMRLTRMRWDHTHFGDQRFDCAATTEGLWLPYAVLWFATVGSAFGAVTAVLSTRPHGPSGAVAALVLLVAVPSAVLSYAWYRTVFWTRMAEATRFAGVDFGLDLRLGQAMGLAVTNWLIVTLSLGLLRPVAALRTFRLACGALLVSDAPDFAAIRQSAAVQHEDGEGLMALTDGMGDF